MNPLAAGVNTPLSYIFGRRRRERGPGGMKKGGREGEGGRKEGGSEGGREGIILCDGYYGVGAYM